MEKIIQFFNKFGSIIIVILLILSLFRACKNNNEIHSLRKDVQHMSVTIDSQSTALRKEMKIGGLETSKRTLYDWNAVVRTAIRPDDRMNQYDDEIKQLQTK